MLINEIFRDREKQEPCPCFGSVDTDLHCYQDGADVKGIMARKIFRYYPLELSIYAILRDSAVCYEVVRCNHIGWVTQFK